MRKTLIKTLCGENGQLYVISNGNRYLFAKCNPTIEIFEHSKRLNTLGAHSYGVKSMHSSIVICAEREMTRSIDIAFLQTITRFEFVGDFQRHDGIFERIKFDNIAPNELDPDEDWTFEVIGQNELIRKLIAF